MRIRIKCRSDELTGNEPNVFEKIIVSFENNNKSFKKTMLVDKKEVTYFKDTSNLIFELVDYTDIQRRD